MVSNYNSFKQRIGRVSIEPILKHAIAYGGIIPLLDYLKNFQGALDCHPHESINQQVGQIEMYMVCGIGVSVKDGYFLGTQLTHVFRLVTKILGLDDLEEGAGFERDFRCQSIMKMKRLSSTNWEQC